MIKSDKRFIKNELIELGEEDVSIVINHFKKNNLIFSEMLIKDIHDVYMQEKRDQEQMDYINYCARLDR